MSEEKAVRTVIGVRVTRHDPEYPSVTALDFGDGHPFGGWMLGDDPGDKVADAWDKMLLRLFEVPSVEEIVGRQCLVLYAFPGVSLEVEGIEVDGYPCTRTEFTATHWPRITACPLARERERFQARQRQHLIQMRQDLDELCRREAVFVDWSLA